MKLPEEVAAIVRHAKVIAVVGLSRQVSRPSFGVARYLQQQGYRIVPINPQESEVLGEKAYPSLDAAHAAIGSMDIVDVFRRSQFVPEIGAAAARIGAKLLWLQEGVSHPEAEAAARAVGLRVVSDHCLLKEHVKLRQAERGLGGAA